MGSNDAFIHLFAGACAGTMGAIATCPLEVVKTRLQSSTFIHMASVPPHPAFHSKLSTSCSTLPSVNVHRNLCTSVFVRSQVIHMSQQLPSPKSLSLRYCIWYIFKMEGPLALWKGLLPNLVGVAPSRAIYFYSYSAMKKLLNHKLDMSEGHLMHILSASCAGFCACSLTNPIWLVKTRLQLDRSSKGNQKLAAVSCIKDVYKSNGIRGFYRGLTASYYGISETVVYFVIYEAIKAELIKRRDGNPDMKTLRDYMEIMLASASSKTIASCLSYPHEVARTRLREEGGRYKTFWQTLGLVFKDEGWPGLYRGLTTQLVRQIPNSGIMMLTYEAIVYVLSNYSKDDQTDFYEEYEEE